MADALGFIFGFGTARKEEAVCVDVAVVDADDIVEAVVVDFLADALDSLRVELEAADFAEAAAFLCRWCVVCGWVAVKDCACGCVGERAAAGSCFDNRAPRTHSESVEDVTVVRCIDDLRPMWERRSPRFRRGVEKMTESTDACTAACNCG